MKTYCLNCGHKHSGSTCPKCGMSLSGMDSEKNIDSSQTAPKPDPVGEKAVPPPQMGKKRSSSPKKGAISIAVFVVIFLLFRFTSTVGAYIWNLFASENSVEITGETETKKPFYESTYYQISDSNYGYESFLETFTKDESAEKDTDYSGLFTKGIYVAGYHFPPGNYKIYEERNPNDILDEQYSFGNVLVYTGDSGLNLSTSDADKVTTAEMKENPAKKEITLSSGNYRAGVDFDEGIYDIELKGKGHTFISVGSDLETSVSKQSKTLKNVPLPEVTDLVIAGHDVVLKPCD